MMGLISGSQLKFLIEPLDSMGLRFGEDQGANIVKRKETHV